MNQLLSYCGLVCDTCPINEATREADKSARLRKRSEIARKCREHYGLNYQPEQITDCDGCRTAGGRLFAGCLDCGIRNCAVGKNIENCAVCSEYPCGTLEAFFAKDPSARKRLDVLRSH